MRAASGDGPACGLAKAAESCAALPSAAGATAGLQSLRCVEVAVAGSRAALCICAGVRLSGAADSGGGCAAMLCRQRPREETHVGRPAVMRLLTAQQRLKSAVHSSADADALVGSKRCTARLAHVAAGTRLQTV